MGESPQTQPSLLVRLGNSRDNQAWAQFVEVYAPLVYGYARKHRLQDADAADLTQDVMRAVARSVAGCSTIRNAARFAAGFSRSSATNCERSSSDAIGSAGEAVTAVLRNGWKPSRIESWKTRPSGIRSTSSASLLGRPNKSAASFKSPPGKGSGRRPWKGGHRKRQRTRSESRSAPSTLPEAECWHG
jgi:Sigma-70 region 2